MIIGTIGAPSNLIHATFTFPIHIATTEEVMGLKSWAIMSLSELMERLGIEYVGRPLDKGNITSVYIDDSHAEICVAWEVEEEIGACA